MQISVDIDLAVFKDVGEFADQIPYATARALNDCMFLAREDLVYRLPAQYKIRNRWTERGFRVRKATKRNLVATVANTRDYMRVQLEGGERPDPNGGYQTVPVGARASSTTVLGKGRWPRQTIDARAPVGWAHGGFIGIRGGVRGIWKVANPGAKRAKMRLRLMWRLVEHVTISPTWPMGQYVKALVGDRWTYAAKKWLAEAIRTAKKKG